MAIFPVSQGVENRISQGVENRGSLISVPEALRDFGRWRVGLKLAWALSVSVSLSCNPLSCPDCSMRQAGQEGSHPADLKDQRLQKK